MQANWGYMTLFYASCQAHADAVGFRRGHITLRLSLNMLDGSTGCHQWDAGILLAQFILSNPEKFQGPAVPIENGYLLT